ncbi:prolyl oligopeptidase family serine peptidase [candidate division KSB1 bacterium]|nr:prolyl oligopeptidase family serine peptidase [candidate division KSB1 bacterium]
MKSFLSKVSIFVLLIPFGCKSPPEPVTRIVDYNYFVTLPKDYDQRESCPLILYLHGAGMGSLDTTYHNAYGIGLYAEQHEDFPFIVVAPQSSDEWFTEPLKNILDEVINEFKVDEDRMYCSGYSLGGYGTFLMAFDYPTLFAAIAVVSGYGLPDKACTIKYLPVWMFHDSGDPEVPFYMAQDMEQALKNCGGDVRFSTFNLNSHGTHAEAYSGAELYEWFLSHSRDGG